MAFYHRGLRASARKLRPDRVVEAARVLADDDVLLLDWVNQGPVSTNWGDAIAPVLAERLSGRRVVNQRDVLNLGGRTVYTGIGSMLATVRSRTLEVWGSGFISTGSSLQCRPRAVHAVRGPLTRRKLLDSGVDCPALYGDPALLFPLLYQPTVDKQYELGVIPHWKDADLPVVEKIRSWPNVAVIDIRAGITEVIDQISRCESIASSALHGLVAAHGYGIPGSWIKFSDRPGGDDFKYRDYLAAKGEHDAEPLVMTDGTTRADVLASIRPYSTEIDLDAFLDACPFLDREAARAHDVAV